MNNKKVCFISCINDDRQYEECLVYINNLNIPKGYEIDTISIKEASSITEGYNEAMKHTDAKYKVYLHQDTFIINKNFIFDIINIFESNNEIGMIGMVGAKTIPLNGVWWDSNEAYGQVYENHSIEMKNLSFKIVERDFEEVKAIDGLIMITSKDVKWREDLFDGWHYYDMSQSLEFIKNGFKVVVPKQITPWCIHDCNLVNISNGYEKYKKRYLEEYYITIFPLISVLIPTYNRPKYFEEALKSVLKQSYKNIEIIIGDDSTNDETKRLVEEKYLGVYKNIRYYYNKKNLGQFENDIKLLEMVKGEYINFLMDDDLFHENKIEKMMNYFIEDLNEDISLVTSNRIVIDDYGNEKGVFGNYDKVITKNTIFEGEELADNLLMVGENFIGEPTTVLFRKNKLKVPFGTLKDRKYICNVDEATWINLLCEGKGIFIHEPLSYFRKHKDQQQNDENIIINSFLDRYHLVMNSRDFNLLKNEDDYIESLKVFYAECKILINKMDKKVRTKNYKKFNEINDCYLDVKNKLIKYYSEITKKELEEKKYIGKVLITNNFLVNLTGSEIVALNIANSFIEKGYEVVMATFNYGYPLRKIIEEKGIKVVFLNDDTLNNEEFDIIWAQHFTTLNCLLFDRNIKSKKIICNIMSPYEPLEAPVIYSNFISLNVVNSMETRNAIISEGVIEEKIFILPNSAEEEFIKNYKVSRSKLLKKICIVSNHVQQEIYEVANELRSRRIEVDIYGMKDKYVYINSEILNRYDAVITIGKTVQYAICLGIPVFCYDSFGGPGWLNRENYKLAFEFNFSGRCTNKKMDYNEILDEILNGYNYAFEELKIVRELIIDEFNLNKKLNCILEIINEEEDVDLKLIKENYSMIKRQNRLLF